MYIDDAFGSAGTSSADCLEEEEAFLRGGEVAHGTVEPRHFAACDGTVTVVVVTVEVGFWLWRAILRRLPRFDGCADCFGGTIYSIELVQSSIWAYIRRTFDLSPYCSLLGSPGSFSSLTVRCSKRDSIARVAIVIVAQEQSCRE